MLTLNIAEIAGAVPAYNLLRGLFCLNMLLLLGFFRKLSLQILIEKIYLGLRSVLQHAGKQRRSIKIYVSIASPHRSASMCELVQDGIILRPNKSFASKKIPHFNQIVIHKTSCFFHGAIMWRQHWINCFFASSSISSQFCADPLKLDLKVGQKGKY